MRWVLRTLTVALVLAAGLGQTQAPEQKRVALVVANATYAGYPALPNAATDVALVRETLARARFSSVVVRTDVGVADFRRALTSFRSMSARADIALVYYAGHAVEVSGRNWLVPVDAALRNDADLPAQSIDAADVFASMENARTRIAVLDACRENPFEARLRAAGTQGVGRGLGAPTVTSGLAGLRRGDTAVEGALLMYSAAPGRVAEDGEPGRGSPFARAFQKHFAEPDVELRVAVGRISDAVAAETQNRQLPFSTLSLSGVPIVMLRNEDRAPPPAPTTPGAVFRDCAECPEMVVVPAGSFMMGSPEDEAGRSRDEGPQRLLTVPRPFAVGRFEVSYAEWGACTAAGGCGSPEEGPYRPPDWGEGSEILPVTNVSWQDAKRYVRWLNERLGGRAYRLLTEAEWEYAARGGSTTAYSTGSSPPESQATFNNSRFGPSPVARYRANRFGLYNVHGNVWEWVEDCYVDSYVNAPGDMSAVVSNGCGLRVVRGGAWNNPPANLRSASRFRYAPTSREDTIGFRVARML